MNPLVLIHGFPFDHTLWDRTKALLVPHMQVFTPDLPGFGGHAPIDAEPSVAALAEAVRQMMHAQGMHRAIIGGMSMGGYVALALATRHPGLFAGLALISTQAGADSDEARQNRRSLVEKINAEGPDVVSSGMIGKMFASENPAPSLKSIVVEGARSAGKGGLTWALEAMAARPDSTPLLKSFHFPAVVIHGGADRLVPIAKAREMAAALPNGEFVEIPSAGHATPLEAADQLATNLRKFAARCGNTNGERTPRSSDRPGVVWAPTERGL